MRDAATASRGLRERKKQRLRQAISDVATRLFSERGFDAVTVAEIARAADVAENTVFNYFPTKEDLFFDAEAEIEDRFSRAIRSRRTGESIAAALRRDFLEALERADPRIGLGAGMPAFWQVIESSPRLRARLLTIGEQSIRRLADQIVAEGLDGANQTLAGTVASMAAAVHWELQTEIRRRMSAGESVETTQAALRPIAERAFDLLEHGIGDFGTGR